jgi:Mrp family chromosome partitioning ATPase
MSKIEKALSKAREEQRNLQLVSVSGAAGKPATSTDLVTDRAAHSETIGRMASGDFRMRSADDLLQHGIIHKSQIEDPAVQVFRELRTKIIQQSKGQNGVILVTGVAKEHGSSFVAQNLGAAFAFDVVRTALVVDCNFRNPSVHRLIANPSAPGLADYLTNPGIDIAEIIHPVGIARLRVIPAGRSPDIQGEHFSSARMKRLIDSVRRRHVERFIVLDGPPMSGIADIRILSELADYVLVVARYGRATNTQIENCLSAIGEGKLLGIVFNDEPRIPWTR